MYTIDALGCIVRNADGYIVPKDVTNPAYQAYIHWTQYPRSYPAELPVVAEPVYEDPEPLAFPIDVDKK